MRGAAGPPAALLRQLRGTARQRRQPRLALLRDDEQASPPSAAARTDQKRLGTAGRPRSASSPCCRSRSRSASWSGIAATTAAKTRRCWKRCATGLPRWQAPPRVRRALRPIPPKAKKPRRPQPRPRKAKAKRWPRPGTGRFTKSARLQTDRAKKIEEDTKLVEENPEQTGENYIKAQQNLPDVIVVGGDPSEAPAASKGAGEP